MRRLAAGLAALLAVAGCSTGGTRAVGPPPAPKSTTTTAAPTTTTSTTVAPTPTTTTTLTPQATLAAALAAAETTIRNPATPADRLTDAGHAQQQAYATLEAHPDWDDEVLARVPERLRPTVEANVAAGRDLAALNTPPTPDRPVPKWHIVAPDPPDQLVALYQAAGAAAGGVPWQYLAAVHFVETRMGRIKGDSTAGAQGPMQFIPATWAIYGAGGDITSNHDAVYAAARFLRAAGAPSDMARALRAYNNSARYVRAITAYAKEIEADERAYLGYHAWQVYYDGRLLPEGTSIGY